MHKVEVGLKGVVAAQLAEAPAGFSPVSPRSVSTRNISICNQTTRETLQTGAAAALIIIGVAAYLQIAPK